MQYLSSCGSCRTLPAQGKTPSLELQTRKMETVCLISIGLCYVLERMKLQMSPGCAHFLTVPNRHAAVDTWIKVDGKGVMGRATSVGLMWHRQVPFLQRGLRWCCLRCSHLQSSWFLLCSASMAETSFTIRFATSQPGNCSSERESEEEICN